MTVKVKPKFRVVENFNRTPNYEEFKRDYLDPETSMFGLIDKYGLSRGEYNRLAKQIRDETGLHKKPTTFFNNGVAPHFSFDKDLYIRKNDNRCSVVKTINYRTKTYGTFDDIETARMVRDKLVECGWDEKVALDLKKKYATRTRTPALDKAKKLYPQFKELYASGEFKMYEIVDKMNITLRVYYYMLGMFKDEVRNDCS